MFLNFLCRPFRRRSLDAMKRKRIAAAMRLVKDSYCYLDRHKYRVLSTELPDVILRGWLASWSGSCGGNTTCYVSCNGGKPPHLEVAVFVYDYVLNKRYHRGQTVLMSDENDADRLAAIRGLKIFVAFLEYIYTARMKEQATPEFDIFDVDSYDAIAGRIGVKICETTPEDAEADRPAPAIQKPDILLYNKLTNKHIDEIIPVLRKYKVIDLAQYDVPVYVIFRDFADFLNDGSLKIRDHAKDMFVEKVEYIDGQTIELELTRAIIYYHDYQAKPKNSNGPERVPNTTQRISVRRDGNMKAPFVEPSSFYNLLHLIRRYDEFTQGRRRQFKYSDRTMKRGMRAYFRDFQHIFPKEGFDIDRLFEMLQ